MKIHVIKEGADTIGGYTKVTVANEAIDLNGVSDNECEFIMANQILNEFSPDKIGSCLQVLIKKLRMGGTLVIGGTELRMFCINVTNGLVTPREAGQVISECRSMTDSLDVINILRQFGLTVVTTQVNGIHYEITARR